jgi:hypothetical protein
MNDGIVLHPTRGVDPHKCFCPVCYNDTCELSLGYLRAHCNKEGLIKSVFPADKKSSVPQEAGDFFRDLEPEEKVPGGVCGKCEAIMAEQDTVVAAGGVFRKRKSP